MLGHREGRDIRAPDGLFYAGWRMVRKGGRVKAGGAWYKSDRLLPFVGREIWVAIGEYWGGWILAWEFLFDVLIQEDIPRESDSNQATSAHAAPEAP